MSGSFLMKRHLSQVRSALGPVSVSIVVPCCNEEAGLRHLKSKLDAARLLLEPTYVLTFILVDDGSTDGSWNVMCELFKEQSGCILLRHSTNRGIGAAILTGIRGAHTEIVCSIDADCSYDPCELEKLLPLLTCDVDLVTGSPYHPQGRVIGLPVWRLFLSRAASHLYRLVLGQRLHTYTSCLRVHRRRSILQLNLRAQDFLAMAEWIGRVVLQGGVVVECPVTLTQRVHGNSKMKTVPVLFRHFLLLSELLVIRIWQGLVGRPRALFRSLDLNES